MSEYVPTQHEVEMAYIRDEKRTSNRRYKASGRVPLTTEELAAEFDRFISAIKAEAWDEGAEAAYSDAQGALSGPEPTNPYRVKESA